MFPSLRGYRTEWLRGDVIAVRLLVARDIGQVRDVLRHAGAEDEAVVFPSVEEAVSRAR